VKPVNELAGQYQVHPTQVSQWKRQVQGGVREIFATARAKGDQDHEVVQAKLYEEVGRLKMELDWIKKTAGLG
jgi:putative transposase